MPGGCYVFVATQDRAVDVFQDWRDVDLELGATQQPELGWLAVGLVAGLCPRPGKFPAALFCAGGLVAKPYLPVFVVLEPDAVAVATVGLLFSTTVSFPAPRRARFQLLSPQGSGQPDLLLWPQKRPQSSAWLLHNLIVHLQIPGLAIVSRLPPAFVLPPTALMNHSPPVASGLLRALPAQNTGPHSGSDQAGGPFG